jgi:deoxyribonuclease V
MQYAGVYAWPDSVDELVAEQRRLAHEAFGEWSPPPSLLAGGCFICFPRDKAGAGARGDRAWAAAALADRRTALVEGEAGAPYEPGLLALREGPLLEAAVRALPAEPHLVLVDATGRDHPRRAGLALQLGAALDLPTVGVTHRPLAAAGDWPADAAGALSPLVLDGEVVGYWVRTRPGTRPLAVHAAWRTSAETAARVALVTAVKSRTPEPLRLARTAARTARAGAS